MQLTRTISKVIRIFSRPLNMTLSLSGSGSESVWRMESSSCLVETRVVEFDTLRRVKLAQSVCGFGALDW